MHKFRFQERKVRFYLLQIVVLVIVFGFAGCNNKKISTPKDHTHNLLENNMIPKVYPKTKGGEIRPTLIPETFSGKQNVGNAVLAYQAAKKIPQILDQIFCYCYCQDNPRFNHKSLLTCYIDDHAAHCGYCQNQALVAYSLFKQGQSPEKILEEVNKRFYHPR